MRLEPGSRFGSYEITGSLGAGGMGEVYRARDARLNRDVAIKVLPPVLANDPERILRFEREAQLLATLNHPHIAQVFGVVDIPAGEGHGLGLVLELVEGGTLAERLKRGPLPVRDGLRMARDIADGLHSAHESSIVHRDLKPANIALTASGKPKILDFGLAKAVAAGVDATTVLGATAAGVVLGTAPYMSPEQTRGLPLDKRTDIWSFGCVLYEMLTGRPPFAGDSPSDIVVAILEREPNLDALPLAISARLRWLLRRLLEKDPANRLHDIADARIELDEALRDPEGASGTQTAPAARSRTTPVTRELVAWTIAAIATAGLIAAVVISGRNEPASPPREVYHASIQLQDSLRLAAPEPAGRFALSPDGQRLALIAAAGVGMPMLWIRRMDSPIAQPVAGTEGASYPFWSPDSKYVGFTLRRADQALVGTQVALMKVDLAGGQPVKLADLAFSATCAWSRDNVILFTRSGTSTLFRISASSGGSPVAVGTLDTASGEVQHSYPSFLPDGKHYLYTSVGTRTGANAPRAVYVGVLDGSEAPRQLVDPGSNARYANGHLLFLRDGTLLAQRLDLTSFTLQGEAFQIADRIQVAATSGPGGPGAFSVSDTGVLVYQTASLVRSQLAWVDRSGRTLGAVGKPDDYADVVLSPDDSRAVVSALNQQQGTRDLWFIDTVRGSRDPLTQDPYDDYAPVWSPDGARVAYSSGRDGSIDIYDRPANGSGPERKHSAGGSALGKFAASWSRDGWMMFISGGRALGRSDLHMMQMAGDAAPKPYLESPSVETHARFSPDGRWVAYASNESGPLEVYVADFPDAGNKRRVSNGGAAWPLWNRNGAEIFFISEDGTTVFSVAVTTTSPTITIGEPQPLFKTRLRPRGRLDAYPYDVSADGKRFLMNTFVEEATSGSLTLLVNWGK
jgi:eukaryotic-like serine/threonine-protein kinase